MGAIYDPKTKKFLTPEAAKEAAGPKETVYLSIDKGLTDQLVAFADEDGIDRTAETAMGRKVRTTNAVKRYVEVAIAEFIASRSATDSEEE